MGRAARKLLREGQRLFKARDFKRALTCWHQAWKHPRSTPEERLAARQCIELLAQQIEAGAHDSAAGTGVRTATGAQNATGASASAEAAPIPGDSAPAIATSAPLAERAELARPAGGGSGATSAFHPSQQAPHEQRLSAVERALERIDEKLSSLAGQLRILASQLEGVEQFVARWRSRGTSSHPQVAPAPAPGPEANRHADTNPGLPPGIGSVPVPASEEAEPLAATEFGVQLDDDGVFYGATIGGELQVTELQAGLEAAGTDVQALGEYSPDAPLETRIAQSMQALAEQTGADLDDPFAAAPGGYDADELGGTDDDDDDAGATLDFLPAGSELQGEAIAPPPPSSIGTRVAELEATGVAVESVIGALERHEEATARAAAVLGTGSPASPPDAADDDDSDIDFARPAGPIPNLLGVAGAAALLVGFFLPWVVLNAETTLVPWDADALLALGRSPAERWPLGVGLLWAVPGVALFVLAVELLLVRHGRPVRAVFWLATFAGVAGIAALVAAPAAQPIGGSRVLTIAWIVRHGGPGLWAVLIGTGLTLLGALFWPRPLRGAPRRNRSAPERSA